MANVVSFYRQLLVNVGEGVLPGSIGSPRTIPDPLVLRSALGGFPIAESHRPTGKAASKILS